MSPPAILLGRKPSSKPWESLGVRYTRSTPAPNPATLDGAESLAGVAALGEALRSVQMHWGSLRSCAQSWLERKIEERRTNPDC